MLEMGVSTANQSQAGPDLLQTEYQTPEVLCEEMEEEWVVKYETMETPMEAQDVKKTVLAMLMGGTALGEHQPHLTPAQSSVEMAILPQVKVVKMLILTQETDASTDRWSQAGLAPQRMECPARVQPAVEMARE